jgi:hypothetical protein
MAHFAELDENNIVLRVVVIGNDVPTSNGPLGENDMHPDGEIYCQNLFKGGRWKQTSYNNKFRKNYAGIGSIYNDEINMFISQRPYQSFNLNKSNGEWEAPIPYPTKKYINENHPDGPVSYIIEWDEQNQRWTAKDKPWFDIPNTGRAQNNYIWNPLTLDWELV